MVDHVAVQDVALGQEPHNACEQCEGLQPKLPVEELEPLEEVEALTTLTDPASLVEVRELEQFVGERSAP